MTTRMSSKGQIVLPKTVRDTHKWKTGAEFVIEEAGDGIILRPAKSFFPPTRLDDVLGCTGYHGPAKSVAEMDAAISKEARRHA